MIVVQVPDPYVRKAVCRAAHAEEDVVFDVRSAAEAIEYGFPRLLVRSAGDRRASLPSGIQVLELDDMLLRRWEAERRAADFPMTRLDYLTARLATLMDRTASDRNWVDAALADLTKAAGAQLPPPLRSFARRILEFPIHYRTLHSVADACGTTRGALKAKFRRRGLPSPYTYLRWLRIMAVAEVLSDRTVTVAAASRRLGFTSDGNMCRMMGAVTGMTPTEARTVHGWRRLLISFAWAHLSAEELDAWAGLDELFERRVA